MPYAPSDQYRGDQYAFQGISNLGNIFSEDLKKYMELRKQGNVNDTIVQHAAQTGLIKPDEYNTYVQANWNKKQGIANGIIANMHDDWQRSMFQQEQQAKQAALANQLDIAKMHIASQEGISAAEIAAGKYGGGGTDEPIATDPLIDPTEKTPVPGYGIIRKTGQVVPTSTAVPDVILDPTKKFMWKGPKAGWQPLNSKLARQIGDATSGDAPMTQPTGLRSMLPTWLGGTPAPTIPTPDVPAAQGVVPGPAYPAAAAPAAQVDAAAARAQAQAKINAGADRDAVIARLKQLGVDSSGL